jgi:alanine dehydrogenase
VQTPATVPVSQQTRTLVLSRGDVRRLLSMEDCIDAVEQAFLSHAHARTVAPGVLGTHVEGGGFHVKTAGLLASRDQPSVYVTKINANFPGNPERRGLPTIQGVVALFDAEDGRLLALLDSMEITSLRTAAATAVAAKHLARDDAETVTICGCGAQSRSQLRALACVRALRRVYALDMQPDRARRFAADMTAELGLDVSVVATFDEVARSTDMWVTCTPSERWLLGRDHVGRGAFVAAVGADNPTKQEIEPELMAECTVIADVLDQCATIGDLHHALEAGVMRVSDVHAELAEIVSGQKRGRRSPDETIIFDSTGSALEDVAAALVVYRGALAAGAGMPVDLAAIDRRDEAHSSGAIA